jgi:hypothetical protein
VPGKIGMISGLFFGFSFGMGGIGAAVLGEVAADRDVYQHRASSTAICAFLPRHRPAGWPVFLPDTDQIVVTGTRDRARSQFATLAPVDVLSKAAVESSVSGDLNDTLAQLLPSFNVQRLARRRRPGFRPPRDAARPVARPDARAGQRQALSPLGPARHARRAGCPIWPASLIRRSSGSKCCATAPRRNMVRTRSRA